MKPLYPQPKQAVMQAALSEIRAAVIRSAVTAALLQAVSISERFAQAVLPELYIRRGREHGFNTAQTETRLRRRWLPQGLSAISTGADAL